jgi:hypothetical protein
VHVSKIDASEVQEEETDMKITKRKKRMEYQQM